MIIARDINKYLLKAAEFYPVIAVLGPRQSGKTTLVQETFSKHKYLSLEDLDIRAIAKLDPRRFLNDYANEYGIILDEIQNVPELLSYIQGIVDKEKKRGYFVLTGSQNLLINQAITQTLAGRISILTLLPLSIHELEKARLLPEKIEYAVFNGSYPRVYSNGIPPENLYSNYISTYVERDVRQIKNIVDLNLFQKFLQLCAGRTGQILNLSSLAIDCGIDHKTARSWLSVLEATYTVFLLYPYYKNFGKRIIKSPKLYFLDTGIACSLLRIKKAQDITDHYLRGNLIESYLVSDLLKQYYNLDQKPSIYYWRDQTGNEVDVIIEQALKLIAIEIKSSKTIVSDYFANIRSFTNIQKLDKVKSLSENFVIYSGDFNQSWPDAKVINWKAAGNIINVLENDL